MKDFVYFARSGNSVKIGRSANPLQRTASLRIQLIGVLKGGQKETELHLKFEKFRAGGEWFRFSPEIESYIQSSGAAENIKSLTFPASGIIHQVLIKLEPKFFAQIEKIAKSEKRKPGPMVVILLERYFAAPKKKKAAKPKLPRKPRAKKPRSGANGHAAPPAADADLTDNDIPKGENDASLEG